MAVLTEDQFAQKWGDKGKFADNTIQNFDEPLFREFKEDIKDSFVPVAAVANVAHSAVFVAQDAGVTSFKLSAAVRDKARLRLQRFVGGTLPPILPEPVLAADRPVGVVAPGDPFTLHPSIGGPATGPAAIAEYTRLVEDGDHVVVAGSDLDRAAYPVYQAGNFYATTVSEQDAQTAAVRLPRVGAAWDAALAWPSTAAGIGVPVLLNVARVKWEQDVWAPGLTINIFGENLAHGNVEQGAGYVALRQNGGPVKVYDLAAANPYRASFKVPGTVVPGDLEYWYHNGHGGDLGWSAKRTVKVVATADHVLTHNFGQATRAVVLDPTDPTVNVRRIRDAYQALAQLGGGTLSTPAGPAPINDTIQPKDNVRWVCDSAAAGGVTSLFAKDWIGTGNLGMFGSNYWVGGALDGLEFIKTSGVKLADAEAVVVLNNLDQVQLRRTKARWNEPYDTRQAGPVKEAVPAQPLRLGTSTNVFFDDCANTGSGINLGGSSNVFFTNYTHRATHNADYMVYSNNMLGWCMIGYDLRDLDPTSTDGADRGIRCIKSGGQNGRNRYRHLEKGVGTDLGIVRSGTNQAPDDNQFEQDLDEYNIARYRDKVVSATATTLTVAGNLTGYADPKQELVVIVAGRGIGQWRGINSSTASTITVDEPWLVVPDATSVLHTGWFSTDSTRYDVHYTAKPDNAQNPLYNHSSFYNGFGGVRGGIIDKCSGDGFRQGISYVATQHDASMVDQTAFNVVRNSQFPNSRWGRRFEAMPGQNGWAFDVPGLYCNLFSGNTYEAAIVAPLVYQLPRDTAGQVPNIAMLVEENQPVDVGLNDFSPSFYNDPLYPPKAVIPGTMANSRQLVQQVQVALGAPGTVLVAGIDLGPLEPLPPTAALDTYGLLTFPEAGQVLLSFLDTKQRPVPLDRTRVAGAGGGGTSPAPAPGYTDAQIDALLAGKANLDADQLLALAELPARLHPLTYPVMVARGASYVGYESLEDALAVPANANKPIVLNAQLVLVNSSITFTGHVYSVGYAAILLATGITLTLTPGARVTNINIYRNNASTARVLIANANTTGTVPSASQAVQLVDSRIGTTLLFSDASQAVAARGRSVVEVAEGQPGTIYLYDLATITTLGTVRPAVIDRKPGIEVRSGNTVTLDRNSAYTPLVSGTFTVDLSTKVVGAEATVYLEPGTTDPALPSSDFQLLSGAYQAGVSLMYTLKAGANGKVQYVINQLP